MGRIASAVVRRGQHWLHHARLRWHAASSPAARQVCLVLSGNRNGSRLLVSYLNSIPGCGFAGEVLHRGIPGGLPPTVMGEFALRHLALSVDALHAPIRGLKIQLAQLEQRGISLDDLLDRLPAATFVILY